MASATVHQTTLPDGTRIAARPVTPDGARGRSLAGESHARRNRLPSKEELLAAHAWFDSAWDNNKCEVVALSTCVDKPGSGAF